MKSISFASRLMVVVGICAIALVGCKRVVMAFRRRRSPLRLVLLLSLPMCLDLL